jgi:transposase
LAARNPHDDKPAALNRHHALNPRPQAVGDPAFASGNPFFDPRDLVQVKYEMLRRVREEGQAVSHTAATFGFSRPSFYQAQALFEQGGLPGLLPQRPGPKRAHKLSEAVVDLLEAMLAEDPTLNSRRLAQLLEEQLGLRTHPRSVERALDRRRRKRGLQPPS